MIIYIYVCVCISVYVLIYLFVNLHGMYTSINCFSGIRNIRNGKPHRSVDLARHRKSSANPAGLESSRRSSGQGPRHRPVRVPQFPDSVLDLRMPLDCQKGRTSVILLGDVKDVFM